jgi:hypothetical protein
MGSSVGETRRQAFYRSVPVALILGVMLPVGSMKLPIQ